MSNEDIKKGIAIQAKADAAKMEKLADGLEAHTAVMKSIEEGQGEIRDTLDVVLDDMSDAEAKALYGLDRSKLPCDLDRTEKRVLCACVYTLMSHYDQNNEWQRLFYANLEQHLGVSERVTDFDLSALEQIDSHTDRVVVAKVLCAFLFLRDGTFGFLDNGQDYTWLLDLCSEKEIAAVCRELGREYAVLGVRGITDRYLVSGSIEEIDEPREQELLPSCEEDTDFEELSELVRSCVGDNLCLGEPVEMSEQEMKKELSALPVWVAYDALIAVTKIANGYLFFTTHAIYLKSGSLLFGSYVRIPYESIRYDAITTSTGKKAGTRKLAIPYTSEAGERLSVAIDDTAVTEEKLLELILTVGSTKCAVSTTDAVIPLHGQSREIRETYLSLLAYILKAEESSLLDAYVLAERWSLATAWSTIADGVSDEPSFYQTVKAFVSMIPYPSARIVALNAMEQTISILAHNNVIADRESSQFTVSAEKLLRAFDISGMSDEEYNLALKRSMKRYEELTAEEYLALKERVLSESILYADSLSRGVDCVLNSIKNRREYKTRQVMEKAEQGIYDVADAVAGTVSGVFDRTKGAFSGRKKK